MLLVRTDGSKNQRKEIIKGHIPLDQSLETAEGGGGIVGHYKVKKKVYFVSYWIDWVIQCQNR